MGSLDRSDVVSRLTAIGDPLSGQMLYDELIRRAASLGTDDGDMLVDVALKSDHNKRFDLAMTAAYLASREMRMTLRSELIAHGEWVHLFTLANCMKLAVTFEELKEVTAAMRSKNTLPWGCRDEFMKRVASVDGACEFYQRRMEQELDKVEPKRKRPPR